VLDELPRNTMGKVQKNALRDRRGDQVRCTGHAQENRWGKADMLWGEQ
jgi:acyl-CoA synthetase (AMP-forming)/AMP-acid ligase II